METSRRVLGLVAAITALIGGSAYGEDELTVCFQDAGKRYVISPDLLRAIADVESGLDPAAVNVNANGTTDIGLMQINSWWFPALKRYGIGQEDLWNPCLNIGVGAWILAGNIRQYGYGWRAVGAYNAGTRTDSVTERRREDYAIRVHRRLPCGSGRLCVTATEPR
jgi:soluble lytic murein transglycosylase-like protein